MVLVTLVEWWLGVLGWEVFPGFGRRGQSRGRGGGRPVGGSAGGGMGGRRTVATGQRFHGSLTGLVIVGILVTLASRGGANTTTLQVLSAAALGVVLGGLTGWWAGRR